VEGIAIARTLGVIFSLVSGIGIAVIMAAIALTPRAAFADDNIEGPSLQAYRVNATGVRLVGKRQWDALPASPTARTALV